MIRFHEFLTSFSVVSIVPEIHFISSDIHLVHSRKQEFFSFGFHLHCHSIHRETHAYAMPMQFRTAHSIPFGFFFNVCHSFFFYLVSFRTHICCFHSINFFSIQMLRQINSKLGTISKISYTIRTQDFLLFCRKKTKNRNKCANFSPPKTQFSIEF